MFISPAQCISDLKAAIQSQQAILDSLESQEYNPFAAAFSELTSDRAKRYYINRAQSDSQTIAVVTIKAGAALYEAAVLAYQMGVFFRALYESFQPQPEVTAIVLAQPAALAIIEAETIPIEILPNTPLLFPAAPKITALLALPPAKTTPKPAQTRQDHAQTRQDHAQTRQDHAQTRQDHAKTTPKAKAPWKQPRPKKTRAAIA